MHNFKYEKYNVVYWKTVKNINNYYPPAHFVVIYNSSSVFTL